MSARRMRKRFLDCTGMDMAAAESYAMALAEQQRDVMFQLGDLYRYCEATWPDTHEQVWPEWVSPGLLQRAAGVCKAYPTEDDRWRDVTYSQYMQVASKADRHERLAEIIEKGLTSDESRKMNQQEPTDTAQQRWCLAIDVSYFLHRFWFSGASVESAVGVATWIQRSVERLKEKGLTDVACCLDSSTNDRKKLTEDWEDKYKNRPPKDAELSQQLQLVHELLKGHGLACITVEGNEADDVMASIAKQFPGRVTIMTQDKDCRQCLSEKCNMLMDIEWVKDETSGDMLPEYKWLSAKQHTEATGIPPSQWTQYQAIMGDATDGIKGAAGIGTKGAADLIKTFGTVAAAIQAAKDSDERIKAKQRAALIEFEPKAEVTLKLVTLIDSLPIPSATRI